jgi:hypothetical protein
MLAAARGSTSAPVTPPPEDTPTPAEAPPIESPAAEAKPAASAPKSTAVVDRKTMSVADMITWCREHDAK